MLLVVFAKWAFGHAIATNATETEVAELGVLLAGADPHAHFEFGRLLEKDFLPDDQSRAFRELEEAVALAPNNYVFWTALGRAREQNSDAEGAEKAFRTAQGLAPNYSRVNWALGNALLRQGRQEEAFAEIGKAAGADGTFAKPAASTAWQVFGGDTARIRSVIGESPAINAAVATLLAGDKRYAEAMEFWRRVPPAAVDDELKSSGQALYSKLADAGLYNSAIEVGSTIGQFPNDDVRPAAVTDGGFESALAAQAPNIFSWTIADGNFPRVGLNDSQKKSGNYSLLLNFGQGGKGFRQVSQKIGVEAGAYELRFSSKADLTTEAKLRCEILSAAGGVLASAPIAPKQDWADVRLSFTVPAGLEGVEVRVTAENCPAGGCQIAGNIWFDDFNLVKR